ncbi:MAG: DUF1294 domain-containing protein [Thermoplasmatota archaeon]
MTSSLEAGVLVGWIAYLSVVSFAAAALVAVDKALARRGARRVSERTLLLVAFVGGTPGLILAMIIAHHKTQKGSFLAKLLVLVAIQVFVVWLLVR